MVECGRTARIAAGRQHGWGGVLMTSEGSLQLGESQGHSVPPLALCSSQTLLRVSSGAQQSSNQGMQVCKPRPKAFEESVIFIDSPGKVLDALSTSKEALNDLTFWGQIGSISL